MYDFEADQEIPEYENLGLRNPDENRIQGWWDQDVLDANEGAVVVSPHGIMSVQLRDKMRVDMTIDQAIRVIDFKTNAVMTLSASGSSSSLLHPNGKVYEYGSRVELLAQDPVRGINKYAKMWSKGISFTADQCAVVYLVDSAGTRTTFDSFLDMGTDFSFNVFYDESRHGPAYQQEAINLLQNAQYFVYENGMQNWIINNVRISLTRDGFLRIARDSNKYQIRCSATNRSATITTPFVHTTASLGPTPHLFVRQGDRRIHYDGRLFIVRNAGCASGFDAYNKLKIF